ncbi:DNA (cytosine-5)-methyltransferase DRM2-like isoform X2 [Aristolochia californica]|uniref:DNA (cytosine-5)-methyltransferase DRM2-like isoform X2 n=1 Tax=Aristolochia californica TaxID=171875 RepID=UPI0035DE0717
MGTETDSGEDEDFSWSEDETRTEKIAYPSCTSGVQEAGDPGSSCSNFFSEFIGMGFSEDMVAKAIEENGEGNANVILETLLTYSALEKSPQGCEQAVSDPSSTASESDSLGDEFSSADGDIADEEKTEVSDKERNWKFLVEMGFTEDEATAAMDRCGSNTSLIELQDFIYAARVARESDAPLEKPSQSGPNEYEEGLSHLSESSGITRKRMSEDCTKWTRTIPSQRKKEKKKKPSFHCKNDEFLNDDDNDDDEERATFTIPGSMMGFGIPDMPNIQTYRKIPEVAIGPPFFYYENVALAPKGVWETISRFLYDIEPEFVDSKHFCAAARKRGYIHNLPINNRFPLEPRPPRTIFEAFPLVRKWWPSWDTRTQLNCLQTCMASGTVTERIRTALSCCSDPPPPKVRKYVMTLCRKWKLVWVGVHKATPLEPHEMEMLLGFPKDHTQGGGASKTCRFKALGNSFQVDTVAYHFSVLKDMFPNGIRVLSLFSGIGGAEVALHRLGITLKAVVSVEKSEISRNIFRSWWKQTNQRGNLIHLDDVQDLTADRLEQLIKRVGGFDLVVGGSPCNNLSGGNRHLIGYMPRQNSGNSSKLEERETSINLEFHTLFR